MLKGSLIYAFISWSAENPSGSVSKVMYKRSLRPQWGLSVMALSTVANTRFIHTSLSGIIPKHLLLFSRTEIVATCVESTYSYINGASQNVSYKSWVQLAVVIKVNKRVVQVFIQFFIYSIQPVFSTLFWYEILKIYHFRPISILENIFLLILICNYTHIQSQYICNLYYSNYVFESFLFKNVKSPVVA